MRRVLFIVPVAAWVVAMVASVGANPDGRQGQRAGQGPTHGSGGWNIPQGAENEKSPLTVNDAVVAAGKKLFASKCQRCHGPEGKGNGPDADPMHQDDMDLTAPEHAARNPDGVIFYKVWNGRSSPKMPTFSEELTKEQVWALVAYVQTLRKH